MWSFLLLSKDRNKENTEEKYRLYLWQSWGTPEASCHRAGSSITKGGDQQTGTLQLQEGGWVSAAGTKGQNPGQRNPPKLGMYSDPGNQGSLFVTVGVSSEAGPGPKLPPRPKKLRTKG